MKMTKKKTTLLALFAVSVIALAGVGYAAVDNYKAVTVNDSNNANANFVTAGQETYTAMFNGDVDMYTYSDKNFEFIYALPESEQSSLMTILQKNYYGVSIGDGTTITVSPTGLASPTYTISAKIIVEEDTVLAAGWTYILKYQGQGDAVYINSTTGSWDAVAITPASSTIAVDLYIAGPGFSTIKNAESKGPLVTPDGWTNYGSSKDYEPTVAGEIYVNAKIVFTITATES